MGAEKQTAELVDFLYRDPPRVASLYAQLFGGHLTGLEKGTTGRTSAENVAGGSAFGFAKGERKWGNETGESRKEVFSPGDVVTTDLLTRLIADGWVHGDIATAPPGAIVRATGTLSLIDGGLVNLASSAFAAVPGLEMLVSVMRAMELPAAYILHTPAGAVVGTLTVSGLHEPIAANYFKHGAAGLDQIEVLGVKEFATTDSEPSNALPEFLTAVNEYAKAVHKLLFPTHAFRVSPIAIFRKLPCKASADLQSKQPSSETIGQAMSPEVREAFDQTVEYGRYYRKTGQMPPDDWRPGDPIPDPTDVP